MYSERAKIPSLVEDVVALESLLSWPPPELVESLAELDGDLMVLGAGGKMGPTLCLQAQRAIAASGADKRVYAVSRFSDASVERMLKEVGVKTVACDLMDADALEKLPLVGNVVYMVGQKFGTTGQETRTWAVNAYLPGQIVKRFSGARMVVFSSGNVYPLTPVVHGGSSEEAPPDPVGEYAQSVLGRERIASYFAQQAGVSMLLLRLNYAVELRYGVLLDIAQKVWTGTPVDLRMGHVNVIWQGDASAYALRALHLADTPPVVLNVTGPETLSVRALALAMGRQMGRTPQFEGAEQPDALLNNAQLAFSLLGYPHTPIGRVLEWTAEWVAAGKPVYDKPTKFQARDGRF